MRLTPNMKYKIEPMIGVSQMMPTQPIALRGVALGQHNVARGEGHHHDVHEADQPRIDRREEPSEEFGHRPIVPAAAVGRQRKCRMPRL